MFRLVDKLLLLLVAFPPFYFVVRFLKWYVNSDVYQEENRDTNGNEEHADD